jgi:hypothetical protein
VEFRPKIKKIALVARSIRSARLLGHLLAAGLKEQQIKKMETADAITWNDRKEADHLPFNLTNPATTMQAENPATARAARERALETTILTIT